MKNLTLFLAFVISTSMAHAGNYELLGKGMVDQDSGDSIALACVQLDPQKDLPCSSAQFLEFKVGDLNHPLQVGPLFRGYPDETHEVLGKRIEKFYKKEDPHHSLLNKKGWNWSSQPKVVSHEKYLELKETLPQLYRPMIYEFHDDGSSTQYIGAVREQRAYLPDAQVILFKH